MVHKLAELAILYDSVDEYLESLVTRLHPVGGTATYIILWIKTMDIYMYRNEKKYIYLPGSLFHIIILF